MVLRAGLALLLLVAGVAGGIVLERNILAEGPRFAHLEGAASLIDQVYYYRPVEQADQEAFDEQLEDSAINGALGSLDDSYTRYLSEDESATAEEDLEGRYGGVGIDAVVHEGIVIVSQIVPDSPADDAGIARGDVIEMIDDQLLENPEPNDVTRLLRGEIGAVRTVVVVKPATGDVMRYEMTLEEIVVPPVTVRLLEDDSIAWLRITLFGDSTVADVDAAISEIRASGAESVILDLRGNGGGWVESAQGVLGRFLDPSIGPAMYEDRTPEEGGMVEKPILNDDGVTALDLPMVVLVDGGTASASEIVAGALKDYDRAMVIGVVTFGKGSVQRIYEFDDGSTMRITVAEWFTPSQGRIQGQGIRPNLEVSASAQDPSADPVLDSAIHMLQRGVSTPSDLASPATPAASPTGFYIRTLVI